MTREDSLLIHGTLIGSPRLPRQDRCNQVGRSYSGSADRLAVERDEQPRDPVAC